MSAAVVTTSGLPELPHSEPVEPSDDLLVDAEALLPEADLTLSNVQGFGEPSSREDGFDVDVEGVEEASSLYKFLNPSMLVFQLVWVAETEERAAEVVETELDGTERGTQVAELPGAGGMLQRLERTRNLVRYIEVEHHG